MSTQEVLKQQIEELDSLALDSFYIGDNDEPSDALSMFEKNMSKVLELNSRLGFMLSEVKDLIRK